LSPASSFLGVSSDSAGAAISVLELPAARVENS
jgi:hypothetical protein